MKQVAFGLIVWIAGVVALPGLAAQDMTQAISENSLGMKFVRVPAGEFVRGFETSDRREQRFHLVHPYSNKQDFKNESPAHRVVLHQPYEIGATEVTVGQFRSFVDATGYVTDAEQNGGALGFLKSPSLRA